MTYTTNYNLTKQAGNENISIDLINQNMDTIDDELKKRETGQAEAENRLATLETSASALGQSVSGNTQAITQLQTDLDDAEAAITAKSSNPSPPPVTLTAAGWVADAANGWWTQSISNPAIVDGRKVDITFSATVIMQLAEDGTSVMVVNDGGTATVYAFGSAPTVDLAGYIEIREVTT